MNHVLQKSPQFPVPYASCSSPSHHALRPMEVHWQRVKLRREGRG